MTERLKEQAIQGILKQDTNLRRLQEETGRHLSSGIHETQSRLNDALKTVREDIKPR
jgi:hypothetical protein